jgi:hypothetical protein
MLDVTQARDLILKEVRRSKLRVTVSKDWPWTRGHLSPSFEMAR